MKILQVITSLRTGGAEKLITDMAPRLQAMGDEVDVALLDGAETPFKQRLTASGVKVISLGSSMRSPMCIPKLASLIRQYDVVHTHNTYPQLYAAIANLRAKRVLVTTEHSTNNRRRTKSYLKPLDKWMYRQYAKIICISPIAEEKLRTHLSSDSSRICVILNGVDVDSFHSAQPRMSLWRQPKKFVAVMVAGLRVEKDQDTLIRAMALLPKDQFELWLVGDGVRRSELEALVDELGLADSVRFMGVQTDVAGILQASDVVVMSSHYEGLSLSSIEGMSVGKPFVASDVDGLHEITQGAGILFPQGDAQALADILQHLSGHPDECKSVADACWERAQQYDIQKTVEKYNELYHSLNL